MDEFVKFMPERDMMDLNDLKRIDDVEKKAVAGMTDIAKAYFSAEAGRKGSFKINENALAKYKIRPRVFRDVSKVKTETVLLSCKISAPIAIAPTGLHHLAHSDAETAVARACEKEGSIMTVSFVSTATIEEIAKAAPRCTKWLQIYICDDRNITCQVIKRAEANNFAAVVLTMDSPARGFWFNHLPESFTQLVRNRFGNKLPKPISQMLDPSLTFKDINWLKGITKLPIVVKGIMRGEDAVEAAKNGASAIIVSNHGARQIEGVCASIDVVEEVVQAVKGYGTDVYLDGGVRSGSDVFRALAMGAKAVFIGRPVIWGLSVAGEAGVRRVLRILKDEFQKTMVLSGTAKLEEITRDMVVKENAFSKL